MKKYYDYFKYILEHKKNVFKTCWKRGLYIHAFTHDLSKLRPSEFIPYAKYFYGNYISSASLEDIPYLPRRGKQVTKEQVKEEFEIAWKKHYTRNKHHWDYWCRDNVVRDIPDKYLRQMLADWEGMSLKFGDTPQTFYIKNYWDITLSRDTRIRLEKMLGLNKYVKDYGKLLYEYMNGTVGYVIDDIEREILEKFKVSCYKEFKMKRKL